MSAYEIATKDCDNPYDGCLRLAGATVHAFEEFGSYQGDWWAKVTYEGRTFWVHGYYGSCTGCDAFQADFSEGDRCREHSYTFEMPDCDACREAERSLPERLAEFGRQHLLDETFTQEEAEAKAKENVSWDVEADKVLSFITANAD